MSRPRLDGSRPHVRIGSLIVAIWLAGGPRTTLAADPPIPEGIVVYHDLSYREGKSRQWKLDLAMKKDLSGKPRPGIVVIHGGGWIEGDKSSFASREHGVPGNIVDFAELGFVAVTINYRLAGEAPFPAALEDCKNAVRWLRAHARDYNLDPDRIGAYGNSAGGPSGDAPGHGRPGRSPRGRWPLPGPVQPRPGGRQRQRADRPGRTVPARDAPPGLRPLHGRSSGRSPLRRVPESVARRSDQPPYTPPAPHLRRRRRPGSGRVGRSVRPGARPRRTQGRDLPPPRPRRPLPVFDRTSPQPAPGRRTRSSSAPSCPRAPPVVDPSRSPTPTGFACQDPRPHRPQSFHASREKNKKKIRATEAGSLMII